MTAVGEVERFAAARQRVLGEIEASCRRVGRDPASVTLVAVSKTVAAERLRAAVEAGQRVFGENRVQEAVAKAAQLPDLPVEWHLIGPLQSNKARAAVDLFAAIESVTGLALAQRLDRLAGDHRDDPLPVLLQVNVDADPAKAGFSPADLRMRLGEILDLAHLRVVGLMTIGRLAAEAEDARPTFRALRELSAELRASHPGLGAGLSMGMSDDFTVAVEEGASIVRVGRALFGPRPATA